MCVVTPPVLETTAMAARLPDFPARKILSCVSALAILCSLFARVKNKIVSSLSTPGLVEKSILTTFVLLYKFSWPMTTTALPLRSKESPKRAFGRLPRPASSGIGTSMGVLKSLPSGSSSRMNPYPILFVKVTATATRLASIDSGALAIATTACPYS